MEMFYGTLDIPTAQEVELRHKKEDTNKILKAVGNNV